MRLMQRLPRETGRDYALRVIKDNIIRLELAPGSFISENELASELGLSRTPVREALIELSRAKVVEISPQKRSVVAPIDERLVEEARFSRDVLECSVVQLVCQMATEQDLAKLQENVHLQEYYKANGQISQIMDLDNQLHKALFLIAEKSQVYELVQSMAIHFDRIRSIALNDIRDLDIVSDHRAIVDAICARDPQEASQVMKLHLNRCGVDAAAIREKYPQYFVQNNQ
jgi:DNA-binding GntR family transcriptional regulator